MLQVNLTGSEFIGLLDAKLLVLCQIRDEMQTNDPERTLIESEIISLRGKIESLERMV